MAPSKMGIRRNFVYSFLSSCGYTSISEINTDTLKDYVRYLHENFAFDPTRYHEYKGCLNSVILAYIKYTNHPLSRIQTSDNTDKHTCIVFLYAYGIKDLLSVTADVRREFDEYTRIFAPKRHPSYLDTFDKMVISALESTKLVKKPAYKDCLMYIGYYPDIHVLNELKPVFDT